MPITNNPLVSGMRGTLGKQLTFRQVQGITVASAYPNMQNRKLTKKQVVVNNTMFEANLFARGVIRDPVKRDESLLRLNVTRNKLYTSLISEYFATHYVRDQRSEP